MASGPSIIASIGADTAPLKRDLKAAEREVERSAERMERMHAKGIKKVGGVAGGSGFGFAQDVIGAFGLAGGAIAAVAALIPKLGEAREAAKEAQDALEWLTMPVQVASHAREEDLLGRIDAINKKLQETNKQPGFWKGALDSLRRGLDELGGFESGDTTQDEASKQYQASLKKAQDTLAEVRALKEKNKEQYKAQEDEKKFRDNIEKDREDFDKEKKDREKGLQEQRIKDEEEYRAEVKKSLEEFDEERKAQLEREKKARQSALDDEVAARKKANNEILAARRGAIQDEEDQFVDDPSAHGEMARRRSARNEERLRNRFKRRLQHETNEENRRAATGAVRHGPPNVLDRIENKEQAAATVINAEMNATLKDIKAKMDGWVKSQ